MTRSIQKFFSRDDATAANRPRVQVTYGCIGGLRESGGSCFACGASTTGDSQCQNGIGGNSCGEILAATSAPFYQCTCGTGYTGNPSSASPVATGTACTNYNPCLVTGTSGNPCNDNGDAGGACTDLNPPSLSYTCACTSPGFEAASGSCLNRCRGGSNPCGAGSTSCTAGAPGTWTCACSAGYVSSGGSNPSCVDPDGCNAGALAACVTGATGNGCVDADPPLSGYTCNCGAPGYTVGPGNTSCINLDSCVGNPCDAGGDVTATCTDLPPPSASYTCACNGAGGFAFNGSTCVSSCTMTSNPCGVGGTCAATSGTSWTCGCTAGYVSTGGSQPNCVNLDACAAGGNGACITSQGNTCNDLSPPSTSYTCSCGAAYTGTGTTSCVNRNECAPNPCDDGGDVGSAMACTDVPAPGTGYSCTCDSGFSVVGGTCVSQCNGASNPCGSGGSCTMIGTGGWSCACTAGYVSTSGILPTCNNLNACDAQALNNCATGFAANGCNDEAPPSLNYTCSCGNAAFVVGTGTNGKPACVNKDECAPTNHCRDGGDTGASCSDIAAPNTGYDCTCSSPTLWTVADISGFVQCVDTDECAATVNPCGSGVCVNKPNGNGYSCNCDPGFIIANGNTATPTCINVNGCDQPDAQTACVTEAAGNACVDNPPPSVGFECACNNPAYTLSLDRRGCVDLNACAVNHCVDEGDRGADCVDRNPPKSGYDCDCSKGWQSNGTTCVDIDECSGGGNPCGKGSCTNTKGGYQCACPTGFELKNGTCVAGGASGYISFTAEAGSCAVGGTSQPQDALPLVCLIAAALAIARRRRAAR